MTENNNETEAEVEHDPKLLVLAKYLGEPPDEIEEASYGEHAYKHGRQEFLVMTDEEADAAATEQVQQSLWAFNTSFISSHTRNGLNAAAEKALQKAQRELCEDANDLVAAMIEDMDHFIKDAISADGRGHFLSTYDGKEVEETFSGKMYFIYRTN
jgi:hypothetical protein